MNNEITTKTGLRMLEVVLGEGERPIKGQTVSIHYEIWFGKGTTTSNFDYDNGKYVDVLYDSTHEDKPFNGPIDIVIGQRTPEDDTYKKGDSIEGLDEALLDMKVGSKRKLIIPSNMAWGKLGASSFHTFHGFRAPPEMDITITIELVKIKKKNV